MINRKINRTESHEKLRLHSSERNSSWCKVFEDFKNIINENDIKFYPNPQELIEPLCNFYGTENFLMGFGSDRCIKYFFEGNSKYKKMIISDPSFPMYEVFGQMFDLKIKKIPYKNLKFPINNFIKKITKKTLVVLSNPSSPIGDIISEEDLIKILNIGAPTLIDEAYIEFSDQKSMISKINKYDNLYITRTFSKALGSAGVRFGLIFSNKYNIKNLNQYRDMYETTGLTIKWIKTLLNNTNNFLNYVNEVKKNRDILAKLLINLGYNVITTNSNWIYVQDYIHKNNDVILKNNCNLPGLGSNWVRLQVTDKINDYKCIVSK